MAAPGNKKRHVEKEESSSSSGSEDEGNFENSDEEMAEDEELGDDDREIQVDFEGQNPHPEDFSGIKNLLNQLFLRAHIDYSKLADLIISQNHVGSVLKQCIGEDEDSDDESSLDEVFGITTVLNLTHHQNNECVKQVIQYLRSSSGGKLDSLFQGAQNKVGFLLNERFINIPPQVSVPLLESLSSEMEEAKKKGQPFAFTHFILISKLHEPVKNGPHGSKKLKSDSNLLWVNAEEEPISELGEAVADFSVRNETDAAVAGSWEEEDEQFDPKRRIYVFQAKQWPEIIGTIKTFLS